jgi:WD40 repeat protein
MSEKIFRWLILALMNVSFGVPLHTQNDPLPPITPVNAAQVKQMVRLGAGSTKELAISPDGHWLAVAGSATITVFDLEQRNIHLTLDQIGGEIRGITFSVDSTQIIAGGSDGVLRIFDVVSGEIRASATLDPLKGITSLDLSPDGSQIVIGYGREVWLWDARDLSIQTQLADVKSGAIALCVKMEWTTLLKQ